MKTLVLTLALLTALLGSAFAQNVLRTAALRTEPRSEPRTGRPAQSGGLLTVLRGTPSSQSEPARRRSSGNCDSRAGRWSGSVLQVNWPVLLGWPTEEVERVVRVRRAPAGEATARFGLKAGLSVASFRGSDVQEGFTSVLGANGGLTADFSLSDNFSFHPELLYSQKGAKVDQTYSDELLGLPVSLRLSGPVRLHYLDLPLLLRARTNGFFVEAGPQLGYLLAQKSTITTAVTITVPGTPPMTESETQTDTSLDGLRRLDVGYVLGVGYQLPQGLEVALRYNGGLTNLDNDPDRNARTKARNSAFQVQLGYAFGGGR